ncbi:MAG: glycerol kinase GlpK [Candidatus Humimicrobiaceae bacterium]
MDKSYILALDQSTTSSKTMLLDSNGSVISSSNKKHKQLYPNPGWVEHDPVEIYENAKEILRRTVLNADVNPKDIKVLSITNQRETVIIWNKETGIPVYNAIVWQCRRTSEICAELKAMGYEKMVMEKTGLVLDPYFSSTKIKWIFDNIDGVREDAASGKLLAGTIDTWLIWNLTGKKTLATDFTNASRTMLFNIRKLIWDKELLEIFEIPENMLAEIKSSDDIFGKTAKGELFDIEIPISGVIGDSQGALFGQNCFEPGMIKATYGTGSSVMMFTGKFFESKKGLVTSIAWGVGGKVEYAVEGILMCTGDTLNWLKDELELIENFSEADDISEKITDNEGVYLIPAFLGLGIPYWDADAKAAIIGISRKSTKDNIVRAAIESIAYQIRDAIDLMSAETGISPKEIRADGGLTKSKVFMQFQADMLGVRVVKTEIEDLSLMGSVYIAGLGSGIWKDFSEIRELRRQTAVYIPQMDSRIRDEKYNGWKEAVKRVLTVKA